MGFTHVLKTNFWAAKNDGVKLEKERRRENMKKTNAKQMILGVVGSFVCGGSIMGCYPLVPAYFAALYLEHVSGLLLGFMYIGMLFFMEERKIIKQPLKGYYIKCI